MISIRCWLPFMIGNIIVKSIVCTSLYAEEKKKKTIEEKRQKLGILHKTLPFIDYRSSMIDGEQIGTH